MVDVRLVVVRNALVHLHYCSWVGRTRKCGRFCQPGIVRVRVFYLFTYVSCWPNIHVRRGPTTAQRPSQRPAIDILVCYLGIFLGERHSRFIFSSDSPPHFERLLCFSCCAFLFLASGRAYWTGADRRRAKGIARFAGQLSAFGRCVVFVPFCGFLLLGRLSSTGWLSLSLRAQHVRGCLYVVR